MSILDSLYGGFSLLLDLKSSFFVLDSTWWVDCDLSVDVKSSLKITFILTKIYHNSYLYY